MTGSGAGAELGGGDAGLYDNGGASGPVRTEAVDGGDNVVQRVLLLDGEFGGQCWGVEDGENGVWCFGDIWDGGDL